ncbi:YdcF family protein [Xanthomonas sp. MUS 060]|uniref:YdcF family protein n=1 Tax=Xanthomonas sp. MUS 060 TaxID=1588031 RepID=UPI0005F2F113|nr:YdcF family protein [Xanthomonas sp. MUS 060]
MTIFLMLLGTLVGVLLFRKNWARAAFAVWSVTAAALIATACGPAAQVLVDDIQADYRILPRPQWGTKNAILVLGMGTERIAGADSPEVGSFAYGRLVKGLELYRECKAALADCRVLLSGGDMQKHGRPEAAVYADALVQMGVSEKDLILDERSNNTWENARNSAALLEVLRPDRVVLVTSGVHMRRSLEYFARFGIQPTPARSEYINAIPSFIPLSINLTIADIALHEYIGIARFHIYNTLGLNKSAVNAR